MDTSWYSKRLRVTQTILRTIDVPGYDARRYVAHGLRLHADVLVINAAGLFAFYPSEIPGHHIVPGLEGDIVADVIGAAHDAGLKVLGRIDFRAGHAAYFAEHPELFARDWNGEPMIDRGLYSVAATSPYRNDAFAFPVVRELLRTHDLDGVWENAPGFMQVWPTTAHRVMPDALASVKANGPDRASFGLIDYSQNTRERFRADTGLELPTPEDYDFERYAEFMRWRSTIVGERTARMRALVDEFGDKAYISEVGTQLDVHWGHGSGQNLEQLAPSWNLVASPTFDLIRGSRGSSFYPTPVWRAEESVKLMRASNTASSPNLMFGRFDNQSRYTSVAPEELEVQLAGSLANGGGYWECTFVGRDTSEFFDQRCDDIVEKYYRLLEEHADDYQGVQSAAEVAVLFSRETEDWFSSSNPDLDDYVQATRGLQSVLFGAHIPFDFVTTAALPSTDLARYKAIVLTDAVMLSDATCEILRDYVRAGGGLVATHRIGLFDERGETRAVCGLSDVLGITTSTADRIGPLGNGFARIAARDELTPGLEGTDLVTIEGHVQRVSVADDAGVTLRLIEFVKPQPPELGWVDDMNGIDPLLVTHAFGSGRAVYFAGQPDRLSLTAGHPDYATQLVNAVDWVGHSPRALTTDAPASVHVNVLRNPETGSASVHFVNYTSGPYRPLRDLVPVRDITVELPWGGASPSHVREFVSGTELPFTHSEGGIRFGLPELALYAAVAVHP